MYGGVNVRHYSYIFMSSTCDCGIHFHQNFLHACMWALLKSTKYIAMLIASLLFMFCICSWQGSLSKLHVYQLSSGFIFKV